jgi:hypothetical protein
LHEIWQANPDTDLGKASHIGSIRGYSSYPTFSHVIEEFTMKSNRSFYGERFRTYFIPPENGNYRFMTECPNSCSMSFMKRYKKPLKAFENVKG